jgi:predicted alpha-1,2-mannosidase
VDRGATFPGAAVPFGFAVPSPDTTRPSSAGYGSSQPVIGFSQTHVSGVGGGGSKYGNFRLTPFSGRMRLDDLASRVSRERALPGHYSARLDRHGVDVSLTATRLAAFHRYVFAPGRARHVVLDSTSVVEVPGGQIPLAAATRIASRNEIVGWARIGGGFNGGPYRLYFALRFNRRIQRAGTFVDGRISRKRSVRSGRLQRSGAWATFARGGGRTLGVKIGLSFRGVPRARRNLRRELGRLGFATVRKRAARSWASALGRIRVTGGTAGDRRTFYSALYHSQLMPRNLSGENAWWRSRFPHYEDYYALWDTFRTLHPLLALIQPRHQRRMVASLIDVYRHTGWLPDARVAGTNGVTQVGSNASVVIADAVVKGLRGIAYRTALRGLVKDAERTSPNPLRHGRELGDYKQLGYLSLAFGRSASRTLEYAYNDFAVAQVAGRLGRRALARRYLTRSRNWRNLWDPQTRSVRPRRPDGAFLSPYSPDRYYPDGVLSGFDSPFFEGTGRQWSTFVPHDVRGLSARLGGDHELVRWLDELFDGRFYDPGNEPNLLAPYLYVHAGRPDRTAERVRRLLAQAYSPTRRGLPGDDDSGALSSWYVWGAIGLYPNAGQAFYYIASPLFRRTRMALPGGRRLIIDALGVSERRRFVQEARLNGRPLRRSWLSHRQTVRGGRLTLRMGPTPSTWGRSESAPSL